MKLVIERVTNGFILYNPDDMGETYLASRSRTPSTTPNPKQWRDYLEVLWTISARGLDTIRNESMSRFAPAIR